MSFAIKNTLTGEYVIKGYQTRARAFEMRNLMGEGYEVVTIQK